MAFRLFRTTLLATLCQIFLAQIAFAQEDGASQQLSDVQAKIKSEKSKITETSKKRDVLEQQLRKDEQAIATVAKALNQTEKNLHDTAKQLVELDKEKKRLTKAKNRQEQLLGQQLRAAYTAGNYDYLKLLLNQEDATQVQRSMTYYQYLNNARIKEIEQFQTTIAHLLEVVSEHQEKTEQLTQLKSKQASQKQELTASNKKRSNTIKALNRELSSSQQQLARLEEQENNLVAELARLAEEAERQANFTLEGLSSLKKKLRWPVKGRVQHRFGTRKQGYLKWKGVMMSAPVGRQVNSIHHGVVLFSDWLKGYGLVTVIDHGNGYMSLYGHNQALLKSVGDRVESGEPIALVGQSGGRLESGLYFEIRHKGQAVNPKIWCK